MAQWIVFYTLLLHFRVASTYFHDKSHLLITHTYSQLTGAETANFDRLSIFTVLAFTHETRYQTDRVICGD